MESLSYFRATQTATYTHQLSTPTVIKLEGGSIPIPDMKSSLSQVEEDLAYNNAHNNPKREEVYKAIDSERDYQDVLSSDRTDGLPRSVGDYITMLQYYQHQLVEEWTMNPGNEQSLHVMRKIAGIAVHCMEDHGAPLRNH
jgi:hypothetical protein